MNQIITPHLYINDQRYDLRDTDPNLTLLRFLRDHKGLSGTKEGCAEGDCGACTVVAYEPISPSLDQPTYRALNACLLLVHALHGRRIYTVEGLAEREGRTPLGGQAGGVGLGSDHGKKPHPVQTAMVDTLGSQCGYCTPGVVMSLVEACYRTDIEEAWQIDDQMCGNLCRCTGYRPIQEVAEQVQGTRPAGTLLDRLLEPETSEERHDRELSTSIEVGDRFFARPTSLADLWKMWATRPDAELVAGGTDLGLRITKRFEAIPALISIDQISELRAISEDATGAWHIGAAVPLSDVERLAKSKCPALERMLRFFGARQIKNRGTIGGNLCTASPIGDLSPTLLALGAELVIASQQGERHLPIDQFFTAYRQTQLRSGEILLKVIIPQPTASLESHQRTYKVSKRQELDISSVAAAFSVAFETYAHEIDPIIREVRLAFGGMAATPARAHKAEQALLGSPWNRETIERAVEQLAQDFTPINDHRASAWYRTEVAANLLRGFWLEVSEEVPSRLGHRPTATLQLATLTEEG